MISKEKADLIATLADSSGYIEPQDVVNEARRASSPLHSEFIWDEGEAAERHWLDTARRLIRFVKLEITVEERMIESVAYVSDPDRPTKSKRYVDLTVAARSHDMARQVLLAEMGRIAAAIRRAQHISEVLGMRRELDALLANVESLVAEAEAATARAKTKAR